MKSVTITGVVILLPLLSQSDSVKASDLFEVTPDWTYQLTTDDPCNLISTCLDDDSIPDLVLGDAYSASILTFLGNGDGSFIPDQTIAINNVHWIEPFDVDLDGDIDIVAACEFDDSIYVMLNDGTGTVSDPLKSYNDDIGAESFWIGLFDADQYPDILMSCPIGEVYLISGNGDGTFEENVLIHDEAYGAFSLDAADIDNDLDQDIVIMAQQRLSCLLNNGDGTVTWAGYSGAYSGPSIYENNLDLAHLDDDLFCDVVVSAGEGMGTNTVYTFLGKGDGYFDVTGPGWSPGVAWFSHVVSEDFDLDSHNDAFFCGTAYLMLMLGDGTGLLTYPPDFEVYDVFSIQGAVDDFDSDGDLDMAFVYHDYGSPWEIHVHLNRMIQLGVEEPSTTDGLELAPAPTPFSAEVEIQYSLPWEGRIRLNVFDTTGRLIDNLRDTYGQSGEHIHTWIPDQSLPDGCYVIVLDACGQRVICKCLKL